MTPILDPRALFTLQCGSGLKSNKKIKKMIINFFSRSFLKGRKSFFFFQLQVALIRSMLKLAFYVSASFTASAKISVNNSEIKYIPTKLLKYGSGEKGSSLCKCSILLGFIMSNNLRGLWFYLLIKVQNATSLVFLT